MRARAFQPKMRPPRRRRRGMRIGRKKKKRGVPVFLYPYLAQTRPRRPV